MNHHNRTQFKADVANPPAQSIFLSQSRHLDLGEVSYRNFDARLRGDVRCGRELTPHPDAELIKQAHLHWATQHQLCSEEVLSQLAFWSLWSDCAVRVPAADAAIIADYCLMFTIVDDLAERYFDAGSVLILDLALRDFCRILGGQRPKGRLAVTFPRYAQLCTVMLDLHTRLVRMDHGRLLPLLLEGFDRYRRGVNQQVYFARRRVRVSRETQLHNRLLNVAFDPTVILLCIVTQTYLPRSSEAHPMIERFHMAICRIGGVINDIISFPKEAAIPSQSSAQNMIAASCEEFETSNRSDNPLNTAIQRTLEFHNLEFADCIELGNLMAADDASLRAYIQLGIDMHQSWMTWCLSAPRYTSAFRLSRSPTAEGAVSAPEAQPPRLEETGGLAV